MIKRFLMILLILILTLSYVSFASAEAALPGSIEKPQDLSVRSTDSSELMIRWTNPASTLKLMEDAGEGGHRLLYIIDWKKNNGSWNIGDITPSSPTYKDEIHGYFMNDLFGIHQDENGVSESFLVTWYFDPDTIDMDTTFDLKNDTYSFRVRYVLETYEDESDTIVSPYTEVASIGKGATGTAVTKLDAPVNLKVETKKDSNAKPYFQLDWAIPDSVTAINKQWPVYHVIDFKVGSGKWLSETVSWDRLPQAPSGLLKSADMLDPVEEGLADAIVVEKNTYYFRIAYVCKQPSGTPVISAYSNVASSKVEAYSNASDWAKPELQKAIDAGLIPDILKGADMTKPITREEFAELSVRLFEKVTAKASQPVSPNPFMDTTNSQILKAYNLGITAGTSATTFDPKILINREQCAAMLFRAIKAIKPDGNYSIEGIKDFPDQKHISSWAVESTKYMSKIGIITGDSKGNFMPKATTTAQEAAGYGMATREQAIALSMRTYEKL